MRVDCYARTSTVDQDVDQQMNHIRQWAVNNGHTISNDIYDQSSASVPLEERENFLNILKEKRGDALLVLNLDRLTRNWDSVTFIENFFRKNWENYKLLSTSDEINLSTASGRAMFRMKMVMTCYMPEDMREKQVIGIARAKKEGKYKGRPKGAKARK